MWARLAKTKIERKIGNIFFQPIELSFEVGQPGWNGNGYGAPWLLDAGEILDDGLYFDTDETTMLDDTGTASIVLTNAGNRAQANVVITLSAVDTTITDPRFTFAPIDIKYTGTIAAGTSLVLDCGVKSILKNGADAYSGMTFPNHAAADWFVLQPGANTVVLTYTGNASNLGTVTFSYNDGWE